MTIVHIRKNLNGQFDIEESDSKVVLHDGVTIASVTNGIDEPAIYGGSTVVVAGSITTSSLFGSAIRSRGEDATISVAETGKLSGAFGITSTGDGALIVNRGRINANVEAITIDGDNARFVNHGTVVSHTGRIVENGSVTNLTIVNDGRMSGRVGLDLDAVHLKATFGEDSVVKADNHVLATNTVAGETAQIVNHGTLAATVTGGFPGAIDGGAGQELIRNNGLIRGQVELGDGADRYDGRGGVVTDGVVVGGGGDDRFFLSDARTHVYEQVGGGYDRLTVSFSYKLEGFSEIEEIRLAGKGDFNLTGNGLGSYLQGNAGDNRLSAGAGSDQLFGGRGDDILTGGADMDSFLFKPHAGREVITDFTDGEDLLVLFAGKDITDVQDLLDHHVKQLDGGLLISGDGTEMFLKGMHKADLGLDDFTN